VELGYSLSNLIRPGSEWLRESGFDDAQGKETSMTDDTGTFQTDIEIAALTVTGETRLLERRCDNIAQFNR
jgi:hypothetical protein